MKRALPLLAMLLLCGQTFAYLLTGWTPQNPGAPIWNYDAQSPAGFFHNGKLIYHIITSGTHTVNSTDRIHNILNAFQTWEDVPTAMAAFTRGSDAVDDSDFSVGYATASHTTQWGGNLTGFSGLATVTWDGNNHITNADVAFALLNPVTNAAWGEELEATAIHEIGHAIGISHSPDAQAAMGYIGPIPGENDQLVNRRLASDDVIGLSFAYPYSGYLSTVGTITGTIKDDGGTDIHKGQIGVFDGAGILVATTLSRLGVYKIEGLPENTYTLRAYPSQTSSSLIQQAGTLPWITDGAATQFLPGEPLTVQVDANTVVQNLTVVSGTPTLVSSFAYRDIGGALTAGRFVFTIEQGATATIGISGMNFPTQLSELGDFILSGPADISLVGPSFPPAFSNTTVAYDVTVDPTAALGSRALQLITDAGEETMVFGFVEVTSTGSIAAADGFAPPPGGNINPSTRMPMQQFMLTAADELVRLRKFTITNSGTGSPAKITDVEIYLDFSGDGNLDGDDTLVGAGNFEGGSTAEILAHHTVLAGASDSLLVVYHFDAAVSTGETYQSQITAVVANGVISGRDITPSGLPVSGNVHQVDLNTDHTLSVFTVGNGSLYGPVIQLVPDGNGIFPLAAIPDQNHYFSGWTGDYTGFEDFLDIQNVTSDITVTANFSFGIGSFPYYEGFEDGLGAWSNDGGDDFDWTLHSGATLSDPTGPDGAQDGTNYIYLEASDPNNPAKTALLLAPCSFRTAVAPSMAFQYHMHGMHTGSLFLEVSTNLGETWNTVWSLSGDQGNSWFSGSASLTAYAGLDNVLLRFRGVTGSDFLSDIAVDNISIEDSTQPALQLTVATPTFSENGGSSLATVSRNGDTTAALGVSLNSGDTSEATVPANVSIPAGQASTTFMVSAVDDTILDGPQTVTIAATAVAYLDGQQTVEITDFETLSLTINEDTISEECGVATATVERHNADITAALTVTIETNDETEVSIPISVDIPATQASTTFPVSGIPDAISDGTQTVTITASHFDYAVAGVDTVDVIDTEPPSITCPASVTISNDTAICGAIFTYTPPVGTDNCPGAITSQIAGLGSGATFALGTTTETYRVTDAAGTITSCSFTITVVDTEAPSITCPASVTINNDAGICGAIFTYTPPVGTDNCPGAITTQIAGLGSGATFALGTTIETYRVTDAAGTITSCSFTITVVDTEAPSITCPASVTINNDAGICGAIFTYTPPVGTDNCPGAITTQIAGLGSGATFPTGVTTNTYRVTDGAGNTESCSFTVTVLGCPSDIRILIAEDAISESGGVASATVSRDNASGPDLVITLTSSNPAAATVPGSITIPAGQAAIGFSVTAVNDAVVDGTQTVAITPITGGVSGILDSLDILDDAVTISVLAAPPAGGLVSGTGTIDPDAGPFAISANPHASHVFTHWTTTHGTLAGNTIDTLSANAIITGHFNARPLVADDSFTTLEDTPLIGDVTGNDSDPEGDPTTYQLVTRSGALTLAPTGTFTYIPAPDFNGPATFTYRANDGADSATNATITIDVLPVNDCPDAAPLTLATAENSDLSGTVIATDIDGPLPATPFSIHTHPTHGSLTLTPAGSFSYSTADAFNHLPVNATANDSFVFSVSDGTCVDSALVTITIHGRNDAPSAPDQTIQIVTGQRASITLTGTDPDNDPLSFAIDSVTDGIIRNFSPTTGAVLLEPTAPTASLTFRVLDPYASEATGTVTITQDGWSLPLGITNGPISELQIGQHPNAALSIPASASDPIHLQVDAQPYFAAFPPAADSATWDLHIDATANILDIILFWDSARVPTGLIIDGIGDMRSLNTIIAPAGQVSTYTIRYGALDFPIHLVRGWNLISLPFIPDDPDPGQLSAEVFRWEDGYLPVITLEPGIGYFVHAANPRSVMFTGSAPIDLQTPIGPGWNVFGIRASAPFAPRNWLEALTPSESLEGVIWHLDSGTYKATDLWLQPGIGYWAYGKEIPARERLPTQSPTPHTAPQE